jgi:hypothetical protein
MPCRIGWSLSHAAVGFVLLCPFGFRLFPITPSFVKAFGTVYAASEGIGHGAIFTATFPLIAVSRNGSDMAGAHADKRSLENSSFSLKGMRVLVADD